MMAIAFLCVAAFSLSAPSSGQPLNVSITGNDWLVDDQIGTWTAHISDIIMESPSYLWEYRYGSTGHWNLMNDYSSNPISQAFLCNVAWHVEIRVTVTSGLRQGQATHTVVMFCTGKMEVTEETSASIFSVESNYPNPFSTTTSLQIDLLESSDVRLVVYDVLGREVARPVDGPLRAGYHTIQVSAADWSNGIYFYRVEATSTESGNRFYQTYQMTVAR